MDFYQVLTTLETAGDAQRLARTLVEGRGAACVQVVGPIRSTYWWEGAVQVEEEHLCLIKTDGAALDRLMDLIAEHHPYDVPEITATPIVKGSRAYLDWIAAEVRSSSTS